MRECYHCDDGCDIEVGYCHCGCGATTPLSVGNTMPKGTHWKYLRGHQLLKVKVDNDELKARRRKLEAKRQAFQQEGVCPYCEQGCEVGAGYCHCGCGLETSIKQVTAITRGYIRGIPSQYRKGHAGDRATLTPDVVRQIRYLYATEDVTQEELAEQFDTTRKSVGDLLRYETFVEAGIATEADVT